MKEEMQMVPTGMNGDYESYEIMPSSVVNAVEGTRSEFVTTYGKDTNAMFDDDEDDETTNTIGIGQQAYRFVPWGGDNMLPYHVQTLISRNMVTAQCQQFNITTSYGQGLLICSREDGQRTDDEEVRRFCLRNAIHAQFWQQAADMKYFFFSVTEITLSRDATKVVYMRTLEARHCRFAPRDDRGHSPYVVVANFHKPTPTKARVVTLLDETDPMGDLMVRLGQEPDPATGTPNVPTMERTFAIVTRVPTVDRRLYPTPYYYSIFMDSWYDIYRLIGTGKRYMIKNTAAPRLQVEVHKNYWNNVCNEEGITEPVKRKERIALERENITNFCTKPENAGKAWITSYDTVIDGKETRMVRVYNLGAGSKEGGDWSEDMGEASNSICFAMGVHPNMVGATPGKSQMNNSGSDKRELFNLKQAIEKPLHDVMAVPYHVVMHLNGWDGKYCLKVPMIEMTTLDQNKEFKIKTEEDGNGSNEERP